MPDLFDMDQRRLKRDRAAAIGGDNFLLERAFADILERIELVDRRFQSVLLLGCPDPAWIDRLGVVGDRIEARDPGPRFASAAGGERIEEDHWHPSEAAFDLVVSVGTLDTVNDLPLALRLLRFAMRPDALLIGASAGGDCLPQLRAAMRAADAAEGAARPHVHPRIEASALAPLLSDAGFAMPVVDVDRVSVSYRSFSSLARDLRAMAATNILKTRPRHLSRTALRAADRAFASAGDGTRTTERFEILNFAAWTPDTSTSPLTM